MEEFLVTSVVPLRQQAEALAFALAELPASEAEALRQELLAGQGAGRGQILMLEVTDRGHRCGALAAWLLPGKSATVWAPRTMGENSAAILQALAGGFTREMQAAGVLHAQTLLPTDASNSAHSLRACGFHKITDLLYLVCEADRFPVSPPRLPFELIPNANENLAVLTPLVEATYEGTLDCPALNGLRPTQEVLLGYHGTGEFRPDWWFLAKRSAHPIGCLILADYPQASHVELVYYGLLPAERGRGYGELLVRTAQFITRSVGRDRLVLAVDALNAPAIDIYLQCGFKAWGSRAVWLRNFSEPPNASRSWSSVGENTAPTRREARNS